MDGYLLIEFKFYMLYMWWDDVRGSLCLRV